MCLEVVLLKIFSIGYCLVFEGDDGSVQKGWQNRRLEVMCKALFFHVFEQINEGSSLNMLLVDVSHYLESFKEH
jgi:hypothetical protein